MQDLRTPGPTNVICTRWPSRSVCAAVSPTTHFEVGEECLGHGEAVENADFARQIVEVTQGCIPPPGDLDPSDARPSQFVGDIAMILGAMIDRVVDLDDPTASGQ